jgi:23S rRNA pseudouridine1911/1915/1917 synthase
MLSVLYEDEDIIVVKKPAGTESQSAKGFGRDMVSEIRTHLVMNRDIHKLTTNGPAVRGSGEPPYVGVIHRLDKPVSGVMVYAKNQKSAAALSASLQAGKMEKWYCAVVCGQPVENCGEYVDYLRQDRKNNRSEIVDKSAPDGKKAVLSYEVMEVIHREMMGKEETFSLVKIRLETGRHHQIRVQFAGHGTPLLGDEKYGNRENAKTQAPRRETCVPLALCACRLAFPHPKTGKRMEFEIIPEEGAFSWFQMEKISDNVQ